MAGTRTGRPFGPSRGSGRRPATRTRRPPPAPRCPGTRGWTSGAAAGTATPAPAPRGGPRRPRRCGRGGSFETALGRRVGPRVPRPGAERLEPEAVQQVVDGPGRPEDAERIAEGAADVLAPQGAHAVGVGR